MATKIPGCFKYGCIGCASIVALCFGLLFLLSAIQLTADHDPDPVDRRAERPLPPAPPRPAQPDGPDAIDIAPSDGLPAMPAQKTGTLVLDLRMGEFTVRPGPADEPIRIEAQYDQSVFELTEEFEEGEAGWTYRVEFGSRGGFLGMLLRGGGNNPGNEVEIVVPRGHPIRIVGELGMGESKMDLGGLWVEEVDLEMGAGDHFIEFREPLPFPMQRFRVDGSMGGLEVRGLGDASPSEVDVEHGMGDLFLDLQGAWRNDVDVAARFSMGSCRIWVPEDVKIELEGGSVSMGEARIDELPDPSELPADAPTMRLDLSGSMGEVRVER